MKRQTNKKNHKNKTPKIANSNKLHVLSLFLDFTCISLQFHMNRITWCKYLYKGRYSKVILGSLFFSYHVTNSDDILILTINIQAINFIEELNTLTRHLTNHMRQ